MVLVWYILKVDFDLLASFGHHQSEQSIYFIFSGILLSSITLSHRALGQVNLLKRPAAPLIFDCELATFVL